MKFLAQNKTNSQIRVQTLKLLTSVKKTEWLCKKQRLMPRKESRNMQKASLMTSPRLRRTLARNFLISAFGDSLWRR